MNLEYLATDNNIKWIETNIILDEISIYDYECVVESTCGRYTACGTVSCGSIEKVCNIELIDE